MNVVSSSFVLFISWQAGLRKQPGLSEHVFWTCQCHQKPWYCSSICKTEHPDWRYAMKILCLLFAHYLIGPFCHKWIFNIHLSFCSILPHFGVFFLWNLRTIQVFSFYHDHMFPEILGIQSMCIIWLTSHP